MHFLFIFNFIIPIIVSVAVVFSVSLNPLINGTLPQNELDHASLNKFTPNQTIHQETPLRIRDRDEVYGLGVRYKPHVKTRGWLGWSLNGEVAGTTGQSRRMEAICIELYGINNPLPRPQYPNLSIRYKVHGQSYGWQNWVWNGAIAGTTGQSLRMEAIQIELVNAPPGLHIRYKTHLKNFGWGTWARDGQLSGTVGQSRRMEAIQIELFN